MASPAQQAPWSVKGIAPQTREAVKEAARRSGMTIGEWLNAAITHQAESPTLNRHEGPSAHDLRWAEIAAHLAQQVRPQISQNAQPAAAPQTVSLHAIERLLKETQARQEQQSREQAMRVAEALTGLARYIERTETRRYEEAHNNQHDLANSELVQTLNLVAHRIKRMEKQLAHLPQELIAPVKEAATHQIAALTDQVIPAMEERLAIQMRDILHNLSINQQQSAASVTVDPEQLKIENQLARAIVDIRSRQVELARLEATEEDDSTQRAILERLEGLSRQLDAALVSNSDPATGNNLHELLKRLDQIDSRLDSAGTPLDMGRLEEMVQALSDNVEALHSSRNTHSPATTEIGTLDKLAEQISQLAQHLDDASRHSPQSPCEDKNAAAERERIASLETAVSTLSLQLRDLPKVDVESLERVAKVAAREALTAISADERGPMHPRADDALEAVHNTLERVVERLAQLEDELHSRAGVSNVVRKAAIGEPERRAAQALSQAAHHSLQTETPIDDGPEDLLARETVGLTENVGLTANFIAAARRAAIAAADETRLSSAEFPNRQNNDAEDQSEATGGRRRSLLIGLGALIAATGAAQIAILFMQGAPRLS